jgi:hypothetical protein
MVSAAPRILRGFADPLSFAVLSHAATTIHPEERRLDGGLRNLHAEGPRYDKRGCWMHVMH